MPASCPTPAPRRRPRAPRGMTLIEISIALLVVGLVVFVAVPSMEALVGVRAKEEAGRLSGAVRYLYGASALSGKVCRLSFDLDGRQWWAECTADRFTVDREREASRGGGRVEEKRAELRTADPKDEGEQIRQRIEKRAEFSEFTSSEIPRRKLPDGANLAVWTAHQREKYTKGKAYLYFFPQGHTERAQIYVSSGHGDVYTLLVSPLNGRVRVVATEAEVPRS